MLSTTEPKVLTLASANPRAVRLVAVPQQGAVLLPTSHGPESVHCLSVITGVSVAPPSKSYTTRRSPGVRSTSLLVVLLGKQRTSLWLNSKAMCAEGEVVFCGIRTHARFRKTSPSTDLVEKYTRLMSSLFGAFAPVTVAHSLSCFVPPANPESELV